MRPLGLNADQAKVRLLAAISDVGRLKPSQPPPFPAGGAPTEPSRGSAYPRGEPSANRALTVWREKLAFLQEQVAIASDVALRFQLSKQIEEAERKARQLGG